MPQQFDSTTRRKLRVRASMRKIRSDRPRLSVHRTSQHIYAQVIDDAGQKTLAAASTLDTSLKGELKSGANIDAAKRVGALVAERAKAAGVTQVRFDRGAYIFHGRVKALAEAAREAGLDF
ncbi:50S ribosomal protein L18 [Roseiterribacter gracilis]|uniref:Large ribosomal subunit protein uL18 n=1 Tax=Roseiterribacter gracilis TaxID=2812848 RepID=A0A8S8X7M5_9PROT|nr:50S ribosomal protein L18 [Rhodospirillales bacterium TMPK1]